MKKMVTILVCAAIPLLVSGLAKQVWNVSDFVMVGIYFVLFFILYFISKILKLI
ncbi:MAG: hypothetical protein PUB25_08395 [Lachnospiraceae bacterium]|nr:hypothetical protein [Lachnospiraceae bacterium]MDY5774882.1 hypothetical protein [Lachnospiraceae bacterium]